MKKFSKKGILLFAGAMAVCAFVLPAAASAASWGVVGTHHTLNSPDIGFTSPASGGIVSSCANSSFTGNVRTSQDLTITAAVFANCTATGAGIGSCTTTSVATGLPWTVDPSSSTTARLTGVRVDVRFETGPSGVCAANGATTLLTGSILGAWNAAQHEITFTNAEGVVSHSGGVATPVTVRGTVRDAAQTLTLS
jgi:hypothetical protein